MGDELNAPQRAQEVAGSKKARRRNTR